MAGAISAEIPTPANIVTSGVTRISIFVSLEIALPISAAIIAIIRTASGPPAPPNLFEACPTAASENNTNGGHRNAYPMAIAMAGPDISEANLPISFKKVSPVWFPMVFNIVPIRSEQNKPCAIALMASIP
jgi:hypothetical protein